MFDFLKRPGIWEISNSLIEDTFKEKEKTDMSKDKEVVKKAEIRIYFKYATQYSTVYDSYTDKIGMNETAEDHYKDILTWYYESPKQMYWFKFDTGIAVYDRNAISRITVSEKFVEKE